MQSSRSNSQAETFDLQDALADTPAIQITEYAGGMMYIPDPGSLMTFYASEDRDGDYLALYRHFPNQATQVEFTVPSGGAAVPLPVECFGAAWLKIVSDPELSIKLTKKA